MKQLITIGILLLGTLNLASVQAEAKLYFIHNDHLGTPQVVTNEDQTIVWQAQMTPFGEVKTVTELLEFNARFQGQYDDGETGYVYNYYRDYDPSIGRYVQSDPIGLQGGLNTYGYVGGNPIIYFDPQGLKVWICKRPIGKGPYEDFDRGIGFYNHTYACITNVDGSISCNSTTAADSTFVGMVYSQGKPTTSKTDYYREKSCWLMSDNHGDRCVENCIAAEWEKERPMYSLAGPQGTNCQEYTDNVFQNCMRNCP